MKTKAAQTISKLEAEKEALKVENGVFERLQKADNDGYNQAIKTMQIFQGGMRGSHADESAQGLACTRVGLLRRELSVFWPLTFIPAHATGVVVLVATHAELFGSSGPHSHSVFACSCSSERTKFGMRRFVTFRSFGVRLASRFCVLGPCACSVRPICV